MADTKLTGLPAATPLATDLVYVVSDPGGTATSKKATISALTATIVDLPLANLAPASAASVLVGRGSAAGVGDYQEVSLGSGMSMTGTVINGPRNSSLINYTYNTGPEPPNAGQIRTDLGFPWGGTTKLWVRFVSADGQDVYWGVMVLTVGSILLLQDKDDHAAYARFTITGAPIDKGLYAEIPVAWVANGNSIISAQQVLVQASGVSAGGPTADTLTTIVSSATPTPAGATARNLFTISALAVAATFAAPSGTAVEGNYLTIRVKSDATPRALAWHAIYRAGTDVALPTTTTASQTLYATFRYHAADTKWDLLSVAKGF